MAKAHNVEDKLICCVNGNMNAFLSHHKTISTNTNIIQLATHVGYFEFTTLNLLRKTAECDPSAIFYIHTKGASTPPNICIDEWRRYMFYCLFHDIESSLKLLEQYDAIGADLTEETGLHYSGNFWASKPEYIKTLPFLQSSQPRHDAERWICGNPNGVFFSLHQSGINPMERHLHRYPENLYAKKPDP